MPDQIVSVRMPSALQEELRIYVEKNHFLDVSEEIRSILRDKWLSFQDPYRADLSTIKKKVSAISVPSHVSALKDDLKKLLEELENAE